MIDLALDNRVFINNNVDEALQELDILFNTESTELIGNTEFGITIEQFLWTLTPATDALKEYLNTKLSALTYLNTFKYNFDVKYYEGDFRSMYHVIIEIYINDHQKIKKEYKFK